MNFKVGRNHLTQYFLCFGFNLHIISFHFLDVYLSKSEIKWESFTTIRHSVVMLCFRQRIEKSSISNLKQNALLNFHFPIFLFVKMNCKLTS